MEKTLDTIKKHLQSSSNILYFYDDDPDGLCSYLLLKRACGGKGHITKAGPRLDKSYLHYVEEYGPDLIVILDKAVVDQEFLDGIDCPVIWIDHHPLVKRKKVIYLNPKLQDKEDNRCTVHWCYKLVGGPLWLAMVGITSDWNIPENLKEFRKEFPEYIKRKPKVPQDLLFNSKLGDLIKLFVFSLKGTTTEVRKTINCLEKIETPEEIFTQSTPPGKFIWKRANKIKQDYDDLLKDVKKKATRSKLLVAVYKRNISFTSFLSNEIYYNYPNKFIFLGRENNGDIKMSMRYKEPVVDKMVEKALVGVEGYGGGHPHACGGCIKKRDFNKFIDSIKEQLK